MDSKEFLKEKAKYLPTPHLIDRLRAVKRIKDEAEEEFLILSLELWDRNSTFSEIKNQKRTKTK